MYYTIAFYIILALITVQRNINFQTVLKWACIAIAVYTSLRYDYPSDYPAYHRMFDEFNDPSYQYDPDIDHFEYGWYLLNRLFGPLGYYVFVTFCDCILAYGIYLLFELYVPQRLLPLAMLGLVAMGGFLVLLSSQRQLLAAAIFLIAYRKLIYGKINAFHDLLKKSTLLYFLIIFGCSFIHQSSLFLIIIPFLYLLPKRSPIVLLGLTIITIILLFFASEFLPDLFASASEYYGVYTYLNYSGEYVGSMSPLALGTYLFQVYFIIKVYLYRDYTRDEQCVFLIAIMAILVALSSFSLGQVGRLAHYIYMFTFASICIVAEKLKNEPFTKHYITINYIWVIWNLLKVFEVERGTLYEYKLLIFNL